MFIELKKNLTEYLEKQRTNLRYMVADTWNYNLEKVVYFTRLKQQKAVLLFFQNSK